MVIKNEVDMPGKMQYIVGRQEEVLLLNEIVFTESPYTVINIYGPGGIGKTVVCQKLAEWCAKKNILYASTVGDITLTIDRMLYEFRKGIGANITNSIMSNLFHGFDKKFNEYMAVKEVINQSGGMNSMFNVAGTPRNHQSLRALLDSSIGIHESIEAHFDHRDILERYIKGGNFWLTQCFVKGIERAVEDGNIKVVLLVDAYEMMIGQDNWMCKTFIQSLPHNVKVVILGRDRLTRVNPDWNNYIESIHYYELKELNEEEAKAYLRHYGLQDESSLENVYKFTGGYPLCLVLAVQLASELGGWDGVRGFQDPANRDRVATQLLERILQQERVEEVREFLEKGVVVQWFDPGAISYVLDISPERGREIYDRIRKFSFVVAHPNGLQFHDRVRELLVDRLKFMDKGNTTYVDLAKKWGEYLRIKAGIETSTPDHKNAHISRGNRNLGIDPDLYGRLRGVLRLCDEFKKDEDLRTIFVDKRINVWHDRIPQAQTVSERVRKLIDLLYEQYDALGENALVLFLQVLSEFYRDDDENHLHLVELANELACVQ